MLSSNTIFHFTDSAERLISILQNEFYPHYSLERVRFKGEGVEYAFPMVCFCDIPLSQIKNHIATYGSYGIGMSKEWADRKGLNPVFYVRPDTAVALTIRSIATALTGENFKAYEAAVTLRYSFIDFLRYTKPYQGDLIRKEIVLPNVKFYDEREWRYVPPMDREHFYLTKDNYLNPISRAHADAQLQKVKLSFEPSDIRYLFVNKDTEIGAMVRALKDIKSKYSSETIEILTSRIMTCEQIMQDV